MNDQTNGSDVALEIGGQKLNFRNVKSLNTIATVITLFGVCLLIWIAFTDRQEWKGTLKEIASAMQAQNAIGRESNCLNRFPESERRANSDFCKQVSGSR